MADFCLPKKYIKIFIDGLKDGSIDPFSLSRLSSLERREFFSGLFGDVNAKEVNALFESKLLLKNQQKGLMDWAKQVAGLKEPIRKDIADTIQSMDRILDPVTEKDFLADLANKKLGVAVSSREAKQLLDSAKQVSDLRTKVIESAGTTPGTPERIAYGRAKLDLLDKIESMKPGGRTFTDKIVDAVNFPRTMQTGFLHMSAPGIQLIAMSSTKEFWQAFGQMFMYFAKEDNYQNLRAWIISHPKIDLIKSSGLQLTDISDKLSSREEAIQSSYLQQINDFVSDKTGVWNIVRASSRAFTGTQNYARVLLFSNLIDAEKLAGGDIKPGSRTIKEIASVVNDFTGRGSLGKDDKLANISPYLNTVLYTTRKLAANIQVLNPYEYVKPYESKIARQARIRLITGFCLSIGALVGLFRASGWSVNLNPISENFLKPKSPGGQVYELFDGYPSIVRLIAREITGRMINSHGVETEFAPSLIPGDENTSIGRKIKFTKDGEPIDIGKAYPTTRQELAEQFLRNKLAPIANMLVTWMSGNNPIGDQPTLSREVVKSITPINLDAFLNQYYENPTDTIDYIPSLSAFFGVGVQSPLPPLSKSGYTIWGDPTSMWHDPARNELDAELDKLGIRPEMPADTINGVKLTDDQYADYVRLSGMVSKSLLLPFINNPKFDKIPADFKASFIKNSIKEAREAVQPIIMMRSRNTDNDILSKSLHNKILDLQSQQEGQ